MKPKNPGTYLPILLILLLIPAICILNSCRPGTTKGPTESSQSSPAENTETNANIPKIQVITTILPLYDAAKQLGGDLAEVRNLLPPGASPHTFEPTTEDSRLIDKADAVFKLGLHLDDWLDKILAGSGQNKKIFITSTDIPTLPFMSEHASCGKVGCTALHEGDADPHIWLDPLRMKGIARNIKDAYIQLMPEQKSAFEANYINYIEMLDRLDRDYYLTLDKYPEKNYVTYHSFLQYQSERYGLNQVAVISEFPGKEPDPGHIIDVVNLCRNNNVKVVFVEPQFSSKAAEAIAREINGSVVTLDPLGSLDDPKTNTYDGNMRENLKAMKSAFEQLKTDTGK